MRERGEHDKLSVKEPRKACSLGKIGEVGKLFQLINERRGEVRARWRHCRIFSEPSEID